MFSAFVTIKVDIAIKKQFIKNKYPAPKNIFGCFVANPYPTVHNGGIRAVAIATPGITLLVLVRVKPIIPAIPPVKAIITSHIVGLVLAKISLPAVVIGVILKYKVDVSTLIKIEIPNILNPSFSNLTS